uniref:Uncharacterized protein n=1 Tax=Oryza brachyantha TaxID=4533 RepID=J3NCP1_ORYBR
MAGSRCSSSFADDNNGRVSDTGAYPGKCDLDHRVYVGEPCVPFIVAYVSLSPLEPSPSYSTCHRRWDCHGHEGCHHVKDRWRKK